MRVIDRWEIVRGSQPRAIELLHGDLSRLPPEHAVDLLVVSAFPNDYETTPSSLIGALDAEGVSVERLAAEKEQDLRKEFSCWLSQPVEGKNFRRILCIESGWKGQPPEITDDLFRALSPLALTEFPEVSVAMPIVGTGDQGWPVEVMFGAVVEAAVAWMRRGLPLRTLKIVAHSAEDARVAGAVLRQLAGAERKAERWQRRGRALSGWLIEKLSEILPPVLAPVTGSPPVGSLPSPGPQRPPIRYDVFVSYSHQDTEVAEEIVGHLRRIRPDIEIFLDKTILRTGDAWPGELAYALDASRCVVAVHSPGYWSSKWCPLEFAAGLSLRQSFGVLLYPIFYADTYVPTLYKIIQFADCRERDLERVRVACEELLGALDAGEGD